MKKTFISLLLTMAIIMGIVPLNVLTVAAKETSGIYKDNIYWNFDETSGTLTISGTGKMSDDVGGSGFYPWDINELTSHVKKIIIENGVTHISHYAFYYCFNVEEIKIAESVKSIGAASFANCRNLIKITIPNSVTQIEEETFYLCSGLTAINIPVNLSTIPYRFLYHCNSLTTLTIPDAVKEIGSEAFRYCKSLKKINIPSGVTAIGSRAFYDCSSLTNVVLPSGITEIASRLFERCSALTNVYIPKNVTEISQGAFSGCTSLRNIYYEGSEEEWNRITIDNSNKELYSATIHYYSNSSEMPENDPINVLVNGKYVNFDYAPFIQNGRTLVPIRAIAEALGSNVEWNESTQTAVIQRGLETAVFQIDKNKVFSKEIITLDVAAQVVNNRTYIPVRALSEIFGASVKWDEATNTVIINTEELTDEAIFRDFCDNGFYDFDYFSHCFMSEHMSGGIFNSYMWQNAVSHIGDWGKKVVTLRFDNYEEDAYKENLKRLLSNVTATPNINVMKAASDSLASKIIEALGKTTGVTIDEIGAYLKKNSDTLSDSEFFSHLAIAEDAEMLGDTLEQAGMAINIAALTVEDITFLLTDFSQNIHYLREIQTAAGTDCDKALKDAIDSLMLEYTNKYLKVMNDVGTFAYTTALEMGTSAILKFAGTSVGSLYAISTFVIEQGASALGAKKYSESVESAIFLMGIHNNLVHDNYNKTKSNIINYKVAPNATEDSWLNFVRSFELTRACTVEAYKCMKEVTEDVAEQIYLEKQIDIANRLTISTTLPKNDEKIFTLN